MRYFSGRRSTSRWTTSQSTAGSAGTTAAPRSAAVSAGGPSLVGATCRGPLACLGGDPAGDPVEPGGDRAAVADRAGLAGQDEEDGLRGVLGVVAVAEDPAAGAQDHRRVTLDQDAEGGLGRFIAASVVARQEGVVVEVADPADAPERLEVASGRSCPAVDHDAAIPSGGVVSRE